MTSSSEKLFYLVLAKNFDMFLEKCYNEIDGSQKYVKTIATDLIIDKLNLVTKGNIKWLTVNVPPRTLKSTIVSIAYTAWLLGYNPKLRILCLSYGDDLAKDFSIKTRQIMQSDWYKKSFPKTRLRKGRQQEEYFETTQNGYRRACSINGAITGRGADYIIIDDPQKVQDVMSDKIRKSSNETFSNVIMSRLNNKNEGKIIVVAQRLHIDDFSNYVQKYGECDVLSIPAIAEYDEKHILSSGKVIDRKINDVINSELEPLEYLERLRVAMGEYTFSSQYQQSPIPAQGNIINFNDFSVYDSLPISQDIKYFQSWDVAAKTGENNDYSACVTAAVCDNIVYIVDVSRFKLDFTDLLSEIKKMHLMYNVQRIVIEDIGIGTSLINYLRKDGLCILSYIPTLSKADRAAAKTYLIRSGKAKLPHRADWLIEFKKEIQAFPYGKYDDQVDAFVQLLDEFEKECNGSNSIIDVARAIIDYNKKNPTQTTALQFCTQTFSQHKLGPSWKSPF